jgi:hypothetical protein
VSEVSDVSWSWRPKGTVRMLRQPGKVAGVELQVDDGFEGRLHTCVVRPGAFAELIGRAMSFGVGARLP